MRFIQTRADELPATPRASSLTDPSASTNVVELPGATGVEESVIVCARD